MTALCGLLGVVVLFSSGCTTTEMRSETIDFDVPGSKSESILDTRLKILRERSDEYPKRADLHYKIAAIHFQREDFHSSAKSLRQAIYLDPDHVLYHYDLGRVHLQIGELEEAAASFFKAVDIDGKKRWSGLHSALGYTLCRLKQWDKAREQFEVCIEVDGKDPTPYYFLGSIADIQNQSDKTVAYMRQYLENGGRAFRTKAIEILGYHGVEVNELQEIFDNDALESAENEQPLDGFKAFYKNTLPAEGK